MTARGCGRLAARCSFREKVTASPRRATKRRRRSPRRGVSGWLLASLSTQNQPTRALTPAQGGIVSTAQQPVELAPVRAFMDATGDARSGSGAEPEFGSEPYHVGGGSGGDLDQRVRSRVAERALDEERPVTASRSAILASVSAAARHCPNAKQ